MTKTITSNATQENQTTSTRALLLTGHIQAFDYMKQLATGANLKIINEIKTTKEYIGLQILVNGKVATVATFDQYCTHFLGRSRRSVDEDLQNFATFGEEFMTAGERVGIAVRDFRQLRKLPEDKRLEIQGKVIDAGDKNEVKALIEEFVLENTDLKEDIVAITKEAKKQDRAAEDYRLRLEDANDKIKRKTHPGPYPEPVEYIRISATTWTDEIIDALDRMESVYGKVLNLGSMLDSSNPDSQSHYDIAATTYAFNIRYILAKVSRMVNLCNKELGDDIREEFMDIPVLDDKQIAHIESARRLMLEEHDAKDKIGVGAQVAIRVNKRGRRPGTKVKKSTKKPTKG